MRRTSLDMVYELAKADERVVFIGSDLGPGVLDNFRQEMPERFFMEGVSEANVIGMAAGLAIEGYIPYVNTIATFLSRRCFEQVAMDLCLHDLPVRLIANGGGFVYAPLGPTHIAIDDIALMRSQPDMTVVAPADAEEMRRFMKTTLNWPHPIYVRLGKGGDPIVTAPSPPFNIGEIYLLRKGNDALIISTGVMTGRALLAADLLEKHGAECGVLHVPTIKPFDVTQFLEIAGDVPIIVTLDEHQVSGGLGSAVIEALADANLATSPRCVRIGVPDQFTQEYGSQDSMMETYGLQGPQIASEVCSILASTKAA